MDSGHILQGQFLINLEKAKLISGVVLASCCGAKMSIHGSLVGRYMVSYIGRLGEIRL